MNTPTPPETPKLAPCPFCGGAAMTYPRNCNKNTPYNAADRAFPIVRCMACWAEIAGTDWSEPRTAIAAWNRRAPLEGEKAEPVASPVRDALANLISEQAEDDALWFEAEHIAEAYFQQELRRLHAAVESALAAPPAPPAQPLRMLTMLELLQAKDNHGTYETEDESIQRKFMEVNGLSLGEVGKDASDGEQR